LQAVDGNWIQTSSNGFFHGIHGENGDWWSVDLLEEYAVKKVMLGNRQDVPAWGGRQRRVQVLLGAEAPKDRPMSNVDKFVLCGYWPHRSVLAEILGVTCDCLSVGRHLVIINGVLDPLHLVEVGIYGVPKSDLQ